MSLNNISIRYQIQFPIIILVLCVFSVLFFAKSEVESSILATNNTARQAAEDKDYISKLADITWAMRVEAIYGIYDQARTKDMANKVSVLGREAFDITRNMAQTAQLRDLVMQVEESIGDYVRYTDATAQPTIEGYFNSQVDVSRYNTMVNEYRHMGSDMMGAINKLSAFINPLVEQDLKRSDENSDEAIFTTGIVLIVSILTAMIFSWWMSSVIAKPLEVLQEVMRKVAMGDLNVSANEEGSNELALLGRDTNKTIEQLRHTVKTLVGISDEVAAASTELATVMTQSSANAQQEQGEIEQVASAVTELSSTADNVSDNAVNADHAARQTDELASQGMAVFQQSSEAAEQMVESIENTASVVSNLREQSERISHVVEVIRGISEQTNLLALNAAIEAARAGHSGRGFAVVADEVRMLAARTEESTKEIQQIIEGLQGQASQAGDSMGMCMDVLARTQTLSQQANDALIGITQSVAQITDMNTLVATAAEQQSAVTQDINRNITNMSYIITQNVTGISQSAQASLELSKLAESQKQELAFFRM
ncbi:methyl-accepting chemotaxis protein [Enterovibrio sp. ZSDZ42]|uniref:Methyl-accepting chemotaxis protein n=1 Tax=Enterovibrio gelatinilyticus TaxID=2899819 RepID=A0ABT5R2L0_9GAMM|nr:methyl-accepting chemotaxis protein [Enterovibrio sp. ZSDZ42]MDD1794249.1 methyl-accepting chemotaxis protein [Enterovibrio sp. ZSDZ42]